MSLAFKITPEDEVRDWPAETGSLAPSAPRILCLGFTLQARTRFTFDGMTHRGDRGDKAGPCARLFRVGPPDAHTMRVNIMLPEDWQSGPQSEWVQAFYADPVSALFQALPGIRRELPDVLLLGQVEMMVINPKILVPTIPLR